VDPELRAKRRREAVALERRRLRVAIVLAALAQLGLVPLVLGAFVHRVGPVPPPPGHATTASFVELSPEEWDALVRGERPDERSPDDRPDPARPEVPKPPEPREKEPIPKGQIVQTAPGNGETDPDAELISETANRVEKQTIARDRSAAPGVTLPKRSTAVGQEAPAGGADQPMVFGTPDSDGTDTRPKTDGVAGQKLELPSLEKRDRVALKADPDVPGGLAPRDSTEALQGNSDRFRLQFGPGEGDEPAGSSGLPRGTGDRLTLFPSADTVDRITGAPFADHVEGVEEGEGTFLNTREWKYASFFNRVKQEVASTWDPGTALRKRDPTGDLYAWKDRLTVLKVILDVDGRLADCYVEQSSGVDFLDREAIRAFEEAQPFPNPPRGILDERDRVVFTFGFFLDTTSRPGLRFFRTLR
jgi:TonB family protein